jgi:farnesyl-diphosphate farnesyltransferase
MNNLADLLARTSRTFALSIRLLPEPLRKEVSIAYLLLRIADTLEDADRWSAKRRVVALAQLDVLIGIGDPVAAAKESSRWAAELPTDHEGYVDLVARLPALLGVAAELEPTALTTIVRHVRRTITGMLGFLVRDGVPCELHLRDLDEVRRYCYVVAGIVGEMLTELFVEQGHVARSAAVPLWEASRTFGEGLQLVNVLKDEADDARVGRSLVPVSVDRAHLFALAYDDLDVADAYVRTLRKGGAGLGVLGFCALPVRLARATLDRVQRAGAGAKLTRSEVKEHLAVVTAASSIGLRPATPAFGGSSTR